MYCTACQCLSMLFVTSRSLSPMCVSSQGRPPVRCETEYLSAPRHSKDGLLVLLCQQGHLLFRHAVLHRSGAVDNEDGLRISFFPLKTEHEFAVYTFASQIIIYTVLKNSLQTCLLHPSFSPTLFLFSLTSFVLQGWNQTKERYKTPHYTFDQYQRPVCKKTIISSLSCNT